MGGEDETTFQSFETSDVSMIPSSWIRFPTPTDPNAKYKYVSLHFYIDRNLHSIDRVTYGVLDWIGDIGGLYGSLIPIGQIIINPYSSYALKFTMASLMVYFRPNKILDTKSRKNNKFESRAKKLDRSKKEKFVVDMISELDTLKRVPEMNYFKI